MKVIGITGGVGAGKTEILKYLAGHSSCRIIYADEVAKKLQKPGEECYDAIVSLLGREILSESMEIDRKKMSEKVFSDREMLEKVNGIIHPAVERYIRKEISIEREAACFNYLFIEAALLIECGYDSICDELWYIHADNAVRRRRLKDSRGYDDWRIDGIMNSQSDDKIFREKCTVTIDNSGTVEDTYRQIDRLICSGGRKSL